MRTTPVDYQAYVINLPRRGDRREHMNGELARTGLSARFWDGVDMADARIPVPGDFVGPRGSYGCLEAHRSLLRHHVETAEPATGPTDLLVLEDDVVLAENFRQQVEYWIAATPRIWDVLYLGGTHLNPPTAYYGMRKITATIRNWGYVISADYIERHLADLETCTTEVDAFLLTRMRRDNYLMPPADLLSDSGSPSSIRPVRAA
jgi:GR25 family glycosyltransferase involved in LPS biosynthesis